MATMEVKFSPEDLKAAQSAERVPEPTAVVIFGASGDLTKRKLFPALGCCQEKLARKPLPEGAEAWFAIPRWQALAPTYNQAVE